MKRGNIYVLCNSLIMNNLIIRGGGENLSMILPGNCCCLYCIRAYIEGNSFGKLLI